MQGCARGLVSGAPTLTERRYPGSDQARSDFSPLLGMVRDALWPQSPDGVRVHGVLLMNSFYASQPLNRVRSGDWFRLGPAVAFELGPDSGKGEQEPIVVQCEPTTSFLPVEGLGSGA